MRSELVFSAIACISNRFLLTNLIAKATRDFHRPRARIEDTANYVFERFGRANPMAGDLYTGNLQPFARATQAGTPSLCGDLEQSVA